MNAIKHAPFSLLLVMVGCLALPSCTPGYKSTVDTLAAGLTSATTPSTLRAWAEQEVAKAKGELTVTNTRIPAPPFERISPWGKPLSAAADTEKNVVRVVWRHSLANGWLILEVGPSNYTPATEPDSYRVQWAPGIWISTNTKG
jgi:hypothetical protein